MELERTIDSRDISKMVGRNHKEVLRDIRTLIGYLTSAKVQPVDLINFKPNPSNEIVISDYFIPSEYKDSKNEYRPRFLVTKVGCELYGTRMTGQKGVHFAIAYIERFNQMEQHIKADATQLTSTKVQLKALLEHEEKLEQLQVDVTDLKNEIDLTRVQKKRLSDIVRRNAMEAVGGKKSDAYKPFYKIAIAENWTASAELKMNIKKCLQQQQLV